LKPSPPDPNLKGVTRRHTREDSGLRLDRDGRWWHDEVLVEHPRVIEAFNGGIFPTDDGRFKLQFGPDWCFVEVEDAAYRVLLVDLAEDQVFLRLSDRTVEPLQPGTLAVDPDGVLCCRVKADRARARFCRDAQFALGSLLEEDDGRPVLTLGGRRFVIPQR
jgi:uncharacterized protein